MDLTQLFGVVAFGAAGLTCLAQRRRLGVAIGLLNVLYCLECAIGMRHRLHNLATAVMGAQYVERVPLQIALLITACVFGIALVAIFVRTIPRGTTLIPFISTAFSTGLFFIEIISLHEIDRILYYQVGPVLSIGWMWLGLALLTVISAVFSRKATAIRSKANL